MLNQNGITLVVHGMYGGGAERNVAGLANYWVNHGYRVTLITFRIQNDEAYCLDENISRIALDDIEVDKTGNTIWNNEEENIKKLEYAFKMAGNKHVVAFIARMCLRTLMAGNNSDYNIIACERAYPEYTLTSYIDQIIRELIYPRAAMVLVQSEYDSVDWVKTNIPKCNVGVIPNCITDQVADEINHAEKYYDKQKYFLCCGRLCKQKQHEQLLENYAELVHNVDCFDVRLKIAGEGELQSLLEKKVEELKITEYVDFLGWCDNTYSLMKGAVALVHAASFEGFPMVILEAMWAGTPVIAYDCLTGPKDIITNEINGLLIELNDSEKFKDALVKVGRDTAFRDKLADNTCSVREMFSEKIVMKKWENVFQSTC